MTIFNVSVWLLVIFIGLPVFFWTFSKVALAIHDGLDDLVEYVRRAHWRYHGKRSGR